MKRPIRRPSAALRVCAVFAGAFALAGVLALSARRIAMVTGVRLTLETRSAAAVDGRVFWRSGTNDPYVASRSVSIRVPAGRTRISAFLPAGAGISGLKVEAPGVACGVIGLVGGNGLLRADSPGDLEFPTLLRSRRFPTWK